MAVIDRVRLVHDWLKAAEPTAKMIGVSPSAVVAQAALESGWGASSIGNNVFGIRADPSWHGAVRYVTTREHLNGQDEIQHGQAFRDYPTIADSFADHFKFLSENSRYAAAGVFDPDNTKTDQQYFEALQNAGYATDPHYAEALLRVQAAVEDYARVKPMPRVLVKGMQGDDVAELKARLHELHPVEWTDDVIGNVFGDVTEDHVKVVQRGAFPMTPAEWDGIVGPKTRAALGL